MAATQEAQHDVVIVGGGPAGTTAGTLLKKYMPALRVLILEKEKFPRDHIGESQLPAINDVLVEMGVWDKVEAANFPVKIGASYTWGRSVDRWDFEFYPPENWAVEQRPVKFEGQRRYTAFQVDRAIYDEILLRHAEECGVEVREQTRVAEILRDGDRITGLKLDSGEVVTGRHYIDASGTVGLIRRAMGVETDAPMELRNIAMWDYWQNAEWAVEIGTGATRVQIRSLPYGWMWFIPLGPTRTSVGLVTPAEHYKNTGKSPEEMYTQAISDQPEIAKLVQSGRREPGGVQSCRDWSHLCERIAGENWLLVGEACGFADPILSAGMSLAHSSGREAAYTILELERGDINPAWLKTRFDERNRSNINQHIRFAQYWYAANSCFTDLKEHCANIAREAGLGLSPNQAWRWLSQGGFASENPNLATFGTFDIASAKQLLQRFDGAGRKCSMLADGYNVFKLNLHNAKKIKTGDLRDGRIHQVESYERAGRKLPMLGVYGQLVRTLEATSDAQTIIDIIRTQIGQHIPPEHQHFVFMAFIQALEVLLQEDWVLRSKDKKRPVLNVNVEDTRFIRTPEATHRALEAAGALDKVKFNI